MANKLYDVIRKDYKERGITDLDTEPVMPPQESPRPKPVDRGPQRPAWHKLVVIGGALLFVGILYIIGIYFVHAKVTITERQIPFSLQETQIDIVNQKNADPGRLSFQAMVVTDSVSRQVFGSAMTTSTTKATGKAVIVNLYSKSSQTIKSGTTFTSASGQKYVTQSKVTVPGYTGSGTKKTPGSVSVSITASGVGPSYNTTGTTFTISGWSGANAKLFYASSAGSISGGQNGAMHTLTDSDKQQATATLQAALNEKLSRETRSQIPDGWVTFPGLQFTSIDPSKMVLQGDTIQFNASLAGTMVSYLIPRAALEQTIANKAVSDHLYPDVTIPALGNVQVEPVTPLPTDPNNIPNDITVSISGQGTIITNVSKDKVTEAVIGISRGSFDHALSGISEIDTASYSLMPFWAPYFPYKADRITVNVK
ncbi:MAG TPA: hypothetical protein VL576_02075 [Candidatus Paceibacterota bacterium]|jgi:hypothetical protein|nr:hypothetical protein [Candidatus Paceibacterota bacterium]